MSMWPSMAGDLLDQMADDPAECGRSNLAARRKVERSGRVENLVGSGGLGAVERDDVADRPTVGQFEHVRPPGHVHRFTVEDQPEPESFGIAEVYDDRAE